MELNNFEYGAEKKVEGKLKTRKILLIVLYLTFTAVAFTAVIISKLLPTGALVPFALYILYLATWRYVQIDYKYIVETGKLTLTRKYGNSKPVVLTEFRIKEAELIAPLDESEAKIRDFEPEITYDAIPSEACPDKYVALFRDKDAKRCAMLFEASAASLKVLHYYNGNCVVRQTTK